MNKCGKGCMPECEYFTTGGCISPFNCMYKEESGYINSATSGSIIYTGRMNMTNEEMIENLKCVIADISAQCKQLETENAALRERLDKAVGFPFIYKVFVKDLRGNIQEGYQVVYLDDEDNFIYISYQTTKDSAEDFIAELKGEKK